MPIFHSLLFLYWLLISFAIIDHIITNDHKNDILPRIIKMNLNNHYPLFCSINTSAFFCKKPVTNFSTQFTEI